MLLNGKTITTSPQPELPANESSPITHVDHALSALQHAPQSRRLAPIFAYIFPCGVVIIVVANECASVVFRAHRGAGRYWHSSLWSLWSRYGDGAGHVVVPRHRHQSRGADAAYVQDIGILHTSLCHVDVDDVGGGM